MAGAWRVSMRPGCAWSGGWAGGADVADLAGFCEVEGPEDAGLGGGGGGAPADGAGRSGEGAQVHAVELVAQVAPGVVAGGLGDADQQQGEPAQDHVGADAVFEAVVDGAELEGGLHVPPAAFDFEELLVAEPDVFGGEGGVRGAQQELAVEALLGADGGPVDAQQPAGGAAQEPAQPGGQTAGEAIPGAAGELVASGDRVFELSDQVGAHRLVAFGRLGVAADHEPVPHDPVVDDDLFDLQVPRNGVVA